MMEIRPYNKGDEHGILKLDQMVEEHPWNRRNLQNWNWKYRGDNPAGESLVWVAENQGNVVATFSVMPMNYFVEGEEVRGSHSIAMIVHPDWQNRGLIKFVAEDALRATEEEGIPFTYGYPNDNAYALHIKLLGYEDVSRQKLWERKLVPDKNIGKNIEDFGVDWRPIEKFDLLVDQLWNRAKLELQVAVIRSKEFLNWRYLFRPDVEYHVFGAYDREGLRGYCVLKLYQEADILRGHFIDLFCVDGDEMAGRYLIRKSIEFFTKQGCHEVNLWMQGSLFFQEILVENGFEVASTRPMICRFNLESEKYKTMMIEGNWYFTMGDTLEIY